MGSQWHSICGAETKKISVNVRPAGVHKTLPQKEFSERRSQRKEGREGGKVATRRGRS